MMHARKNQTVSAAAVDDRAGTKVLFAKRAAADQAADFLQRIRAGLPKPAASDLPRVSGR